MGVESPELSPRRGESSVEEAVDEEWSSSEQSEIHVKLEERDSAGDVCVPVSATNSLPHRRSNLLLIQLSGYVYRGEKNQYFQL